MKGKEVSWDSYLWEPGRGKTMKESCTGAEQRKRVFSPRSRARQREKEDVGPLLDWNLVVRSQR